MYMQTMIESPLNYTGGKFRLLPQLLPLLPREAGTVVDLFCGGCNVGLNMECRRAVFNDSNVLLVDMYRTLVERPSADTVAEIEALAADYGLSDTSSHGYARYGCDSNRGAGDYNRPGYMKLRDDFNAAEIHDREYFLRMYVLIVYAFNNQIRFNSRGEFNLPVGKRDFNLRMRMKLTSFIDRVRAGDYLFMSEDFRRVEPEALGDAPFVYADPPYLAGRAAYNERGGWSEGDERDLLDYLDALDARGIRFALSNALSNKGRTNDIVAAWAERNSWRYRMVHLDCDYANSNYHGTAEGQRTDEVLIMNY